MRYWKAIVSLVCLAIWLPATQHCRLERLPGLGFLHCPNDTPGTSDCQGDACDTVEKGSYKKSENADLMVLRLPALFVVKITPLILQEAKPVSVATALSVGPPREAPERWQFYSPLALPIRGPSLPS